MRARTSSASRSPPAPDAPSGPVGNRTSSFESPARRLAPAPSPFGIWTRRTAGALYSPDLARLSSDWRLPSRCVSNSPAVCPSIPGAPSLRVRRNASLSHSMSMWCASVFSARFLSSFASFAIRCCFVEMVSGLGVPFIFPSSSSTFRRPLPSAGSSSVSSPASSVLRGAPTPCCSSLGVALVARSAVPPSSVFRSPQSRTHLQRGRGC